MQNTLYYGDNLAILRDREYFTHSSVDLIYLDPPFNSNRSYNVLFKQESGEDSEAQIQAFDDTWHWAGAAATYHELLTVTDGKVGEMIGALHSVLGENPMMAYLVMMAARLVELHRVLKPTGSLYLHCDPTASHYLKVVLDTIFGPHLFLNEIVWQRTGAHNDARRFGRINDSLLFYAKSERYTFNPQYTEYAEEYVKERYRYSDSDGRLYWANTMTAAGPGPTRIFRGVEKQPPVGSHWRFSQAEIDRMEQDGHIYYSKAGMPYVKSYLDERKGRPVQSLWTDIVMSKSGSERLGYQTQKPVALLERIVAASSNPGDVVLDPFCGCGTSIAAAQKLGRTWIGIDVTHLAISLQKYRLKAAFGIEDGKDYAVVGEPQDLASAEQLANDNRYQFQWWALSLVKARPLGGEEGSKQGKKGADKGIDGQIIFIEDNTGKPKKVLVQVKSGNVNRATVGELRGTVEREGAAIGVLITLEPATKPMLAEAAAAGFYETLHWGNFPRLQVLTVEDLLHRAKRLEMPPQRQTAITFKQAPKEKPKSAAKQAGLGLE